MRASLAVVLEMELGGKVNNFSWKDAKIIFEFRKMWKNCFYLAHNCEQVVWQIVICLVEERKVTYQIWITPAIIKLVPYAFCNS